MLVRCHPLLGLASVSCVVPGTTALSRQRYEHCASTFLSAGLERLFRLFNVQHMYWQSRKNRRQSIVPLTPQLTQVCIRSSYDLSCFLACSFFPYNLARAMCSAHLQWGRPASSLYQMRSFAVSSTTSKQIRRNSSIPTVGLICLQRASTPSHRRRRTSAI